MRGRLRALPNRLYFDHASSASNIAVDAMSLFDQDGETFSRTDLRWGAPSQGVMDKKYNMITSYEVSWQVSGSGGGGGGGGGGSGPRCIGVRASGGKSAPTIQPDMRRVRQEAERNLETARQKRRQKQTGGATAPQSGEEEGDDGAVSAATPTITLVPLPSARRATIDGAGRAPPGLGGGISKPGGGGFASQLAAKSVSYFGNWIISLDDGEGGGGGTGGGTGGRGGGGDGFESVVIRHIEHERSGFRLAGSVVGSLSFIDSRIPPRTHMLAPPPPWAAAAARRSSTAWVNEWSDVSGGGGRARGGGHMGNLMAQTI